MPKTKLTDKQRRFCEQYLVDSNATQAAVRAGYSARTAHSIGAENLTKPEVRAYLTGLLDSEGIDTRAQQKACISELMALSFSSITDVLSIEDGKVSIKNSAQWSDNAARAVESVRVGKDGSLSIKMHSKPSAIKILGDHLGLCGDLNTALGALMKYGHIEWIDPETHSFSYYPGSAEDYANYLDNQRRQEQKNSET